MFINPFTGQINFRTLGNNQWKPHPLGPRTVASEKDCLHTSQHELSDGVSPRRSLFFELAIQGRRNVDRCSN